MYIFKIFEFRKQDNWRKVDQNRSLWALSAIMNTDYGSKLYKQIVGVPMGTNCAPLLLQICFCFVTKKKKLTVVPFSRKSGKYYKKNKKNNNNILIQPLDIWMTKYW